MAGEVAETLVDHAHDVAIDLHRQDTLLPEQLGRQHVAPAAGADDRNPGVAAQVVHEVGEVPPEKIDFCEVAIEADELRARMGVDLQPAGRGVQRALELGAHAPPQRDGRLQDRDPRERVPALVVGGFRITALDRLDVESRDFISGEIDAAPDRRAGECRGHKGSDHLRPASQKRY